MKWIFHYSCNLAGLYNESRRTSYPECDHLTITLFESTFTAEILFPIYSNCAVLIHYFLNNILCTYSLLLLLLMSPLITESTQQKRTRMVREKEFRSPTNAISYHHVKAGKKNLCKSYTLQGCFSFVPYAVPHLHSSTTQLLLFNAVPNVRFFHYFKASGEQLIPKNRKSVESAAGIKKQVWKSTDPSRPKILRLQLVYHWSAQTVQSICGADRNFYI